jgi:hypothetical protein
MGFKEVLRSTSLEGARVLQKLEASKHIASYPGHLSESGHGQRAHPSGNALRCRLDVGKCEFCGL